MTRLLASLRWRHLRWVACAALVPVLWACNARKLAGPNAQPSAVEQKVFVQSLNRDLDILFMIDNSSSMIPMQQALTSNLQAFMTPLENLQGGLPNLHIGIISSSMGAGMYSDVDGCFPETLENDDGAFHTLGRNPVGCSALRPNEKFIVANSMMNNFANPADSVADVFSCMALLGASGCGFEHQFYAIQRALERAETPIGDRPSDPANGGFLRPEAALAIIMLTNEDDCSAPGSDLFNPGQTSNSDPLGGLQTGYRCVEYGYLCDGAPPPRALTMTPTQPLGNCVSNEPAPDGNGRLIGVKAMANYVKSFKAGRPEKIFVAAVTGPTTTVAAELRPNIQTNSGARESQPAIVHSCTGPNGIFADPAIRISQFVNEFGANNGLVQDICTLDFAGAMRQIAEALSRIIGPQCVTQRCNADATNRPCVVDNEMGEPDCRVIERRQTDAGNFVLDPRPYCMAGNSNAPCWRLGAGTNCGMGGGNALELCRDAACDQTVRPADSVNADVSCALALP
jgi:hypothetical protein